MTTPNTTGQSDEARELVRLVIGYRPMNERDWTITIQEREWVALKDRLAIAIDAAIARAREEARREALEEAAQVCLDERRGHYLRDDPTRMDAAGYCYHRIRALIPNTPQGETKEQP